MPATVLAVELDLFGPPPPPAARARRTDPATSVSAAGTIDTAYLEELVLYELRAAPAGLTSHELAERTGRSLVSISPRLCPMERRGLVRRAGRRRTPSGATATVWQSRDDS